MKLSRGQEAGIRNGCAAFPDIRLQQGNCQWKVGFSDKETEKLEEFNNSIQVGVEEGQGSVLKPGCRARVLRGRASPRAKEAWEEAALGGIKNCNLLFSGHHYSNAWGWKSSHFSNENYLLPHEICLNIVPSEVLPFKYIKSVHEKLQDGLKSETLRNIGQNHQATEKAEKQDTTTALWQLHQKELMSFEK